MPYQLPLEPGGLPSSASPDRKQSQSATRYSYRIQQGKGLLSQKAYTLRYGSIRRGEELIDEVLIALFRAPHSFTGEDTVEITCHGSVYIQQQIMQLLIERGCAPPSPGEYTQRAFMNGKMDLSQAEAVS